MENHMNTISTDQLIKDIYCLEDLALYNSNRYKFDPTMSRMHNEYLEEIKKIISKIQGDK